MANWYLPSTDWHDMAPQLQPHYSHPLRKSHRTFVSILIWTTAIQGEHGLAPNRPTARAPEWQQLRSQ